MLDKTRLLLLKASIPDGARWITVHSNGPSAKGQPVLIQPQPDGSAKVIGGAGGALNHLKIRAVRSEADYKREAAQKKQAQTAAKKEQRVKDKEAGILESKTAAKKAVREQQHEHEREFIDTVGKAAGWSPEATAFDASAHDGVSDAALARLAHEHHKQLLQAANAVVEDSRKRLVADADARQQAGLVEVPITVSDPEKLSVEDLAPAPANGAGLGFAPDYKGRAEAAGLTKEDAKAEADASRQLTPEERSARIKRGQTAKMVQLELKGLRDKMPEIVSKDLESATQAVELLKAQKKLREIGKQAREANKKIDAEVKTVEPKAFVLQYEASPELEEKIKQDIDGELRTAKTTAFLSDFRHMAGEAPEETLGKHIGVGAFNSINSLALAAGGDALIDRSVVDVLGIAGAAQVLARRLHTDMAEDMPALAKGMQDFHLNHYMATSQKAMDEAKKMMDAAHEIEVGEGSRAHELQGAQELNARRRNAINDAQKIMGQAYGEMEANAALTAALGRPAAKSVEVPLGSLSLENAIQRARAIGLQRGDYQVEHVGNDTFLTVNEGGMDRLAKPVSRDDIKQVQRNLEIMRGDHDEGDWLPGGVARRPDLVMDIKPGVAPTLAKPFDPGADLAQSLRDYIGGRAADGDPAADILADVQSADFFTKSGNPAAYQAALDDVAPLKGQDGNQQLAEALGDKFDGYADAYVEREYGGKRSPLNRQKLEIDQTSVDALHRALAEHPDGVAAFKQIGELTNQDQRALRETFYRDVAKESPKAASMRAELEQLQGQEPERETEDMFGEKAANPGHSDWKARRDELSSKLGDASLDWAKYTDTMRGNENAYEAVQDLIKSRVAKSFADNHNRLRPGAPIKNGRSVIRQNLNHLDATDPVARDERMARERELSDTLRERTQGRYSGGAVSDKLDAAREQRQAFEQAQMGFFSNEEAAPTAPAALRGDERHTLGHEAERQLAGMVGMVGKNFKPGRPTKLWSPSMSGGDNFARQRSIKLIEENERLGLHLGAGSGKSLVSMAGFTHLHGQGKVKRAVFAVPSIVQGQFGGEALRYLEPGKFNWHCEPGASRDERIAAYKNPDHHFVVTTHQALRDDLIHLGARGAGMNEADMRERLAGMTRTERKGWMRDVMSREGIDFDYSAVDEGHNLLDRAGKDDSGMSMALGALTDNTKYHVSMTADPVRNDDASEVFSALQKVAPDRYTDRDAFMRRYGADTLSARDGLKQEMSRYFYAHSIQPKVKADRKQVNVELAPGQKTAIAALDKDVAAMRIARMRGAVDVAAAKRVSPEAFASAPPDKHEAIAKGLQSALGVVKETATQRIINEHPESAKADELVRQVKARPGKPGIVFTRSLAAVEQLRKRLEGEGMRVVTISGADSSQEKDRKRQMFSPDSGPAQADVLVASDAASTGLNAQRGQWVMQYDTPATAMTHAQRQARVHRIGQQNDVELIDIVGDHASERRARARLERKYAMRNLMSSPLEKLDDSGLAYFLQQARASQTQAA